MPKRGIHPLLNKMTIVLRNGASVEVPSVMHSSKPIIMQSDPTSHPYWTGKARTAGDDDGRISQFSSKFEGFGGGLPGAEEEENFRAAPEKQKEPVKKSKEPVKRKK